jgi:hypothetical protein
MSRFGDREADQLLYRSAKLEKRNKELIEKINDELIPLLRQEQAANEILVKTLLTLVKRDGGSIVISDEDAVLTGGVKFKRDEDAKTTTLSIQETEVPECQK